MTRTELEAIYEALACRIDEVGEANSPLYLAKLALLLAERLGDATAVQSCLDDAAQALDA
ncbi:hypothetical protein M4578_13640 [Salipiger sp. P9]|uniref:hypothetical protein n=1 Tax=Salipiger pentaromativorans TaxID=2943193 RepID=UPI0021570E9C|nr:hypothetical protein [Salipiger pentaromativorans]MCR8548874.1 hypothetical protein [Salipiger pentaromativorans]